MRSSHGSFGCHWRDQDNATQFRRRLPLSKLSGGETWKLAWPPHRTARPPFVVRYQSLSAYARALAWPLASELESGVGPAANRRLRMSRRRSLLRSKLRPRYKLAGQSRSTGLDQIECFVCATASAFAVDLLN